MARGWESKSVESQQEAALSNRDSRTPPTPTQQKIDALELSRKRILIDIAASTNPRFIALKTKALEHLEREIARLTSPAPSTTQSAPRDRPK